MATEKVVEIRGGGQNPTLQELRGRLATYGTEIREYLDKHEATIETYKLSVGKEGDGFTIEVGIKASIHPRNRTDIHK